MAMIAPLRALRSSKGLSQRALARRAGVAFRTLQLLETGRHDPRWSTLERIAKALGEPVSALLPAQGSPLPPDSVAAVSTRILREGPDSWRLWLFEFVDAMRRRPSVELVSTAPDPRLSHRLLALLASTAEALCAEQGLPIPWWCAGVPPLEEPWFVSGVESLKASALVESPEAFRKRNIFVLRNFLERA